MNSLFQNPRLLVVSVGLIVVAGTSALSTIVRQEDPSITNGVAVIVTPYPGASAERVEALVTDKIEDELRELSEIDVISSSSKNGVSVVTVEIDETIRGPGTEKAFSKIRDALDDASRELPAGALAPIFDDERFGSYTRLVGLKWSGSRPPQRGILKRFGEELQDRLRNVDGTDTVKIFGAPDEEIAVRFDPDAVATARLTAGQVAEALTNSDAKVAAGAMRDRARRVLIEVAGELDSLQRIREVPVSVGDQGRVLRVGDVAEVTRGVTDPPSNLASVDGAPAVVVAAQIGEGVAFDGWSAEADRVIARFESTLPHGVSLVTIFDQADYTRARLSDLVGNLATGLLLVVIVLFISMGWRSALIVSATLPLVSLASIAVLNYLAVPIHQMSVTGLIVALGLLVDNAIVVTDAIREKRLQGMPARQAVTSTITHLWSPLLSSTVTTVLAFMPILLLAGRVGEFVGAIGLSVIVALSTSYLIAMTIVPALASRLIRPVQQGRMGLLQSGLTLAGPARWFDRSVGWSLRNPRLSILASSVLPVLGVIGALTLPRQFFPPADRDQFYIEMRLPEQVAIRETQRTAGLVEAALRRRSEILSVGWFIGRSAPPFYYNLKQEQDGTPSYAQAIVKAASVGDVQRLLPLLQRELDTAFPEAQILVRELLQGPPVDAPVEIRLYGPDVAVLRELGEQLRERMARLPIITHSLATLTAGSPKLWFEADEVEARLAGLSLVDIAGQMNLHLEGVPGGTLLEGTEEIPIRVRVGGETQSDVSKIRSTVLLPTGPGVPNLSGAAPAPSSFVGIPLETLVKPALRPVLDGIPHRDGRRVNIIRGYTDAGVYPEAAFNQLNRVLAEDPLALPVGYTLEFGGDAEKQAKAMGNLFAFVPVLVVMMLAVVVLSLNSFRLGAMVFAVAFQSIGLGLLSLAVLRYPLGFQALIGLIGLVGVAINAAIIISSALLARPRSVAGDVADIQQTVVGQTSRHIISTTVTTFGGFLPLILAEGGFWPPFASGIAGGVLLSTLISFYFVPAVFLLATRRRPFGIVEDERESAPAQFQEVLS